jgi:hypothetical protein
MRTFPPTTRVARASTASACSLGVALALAACGSTTVKTVTKTVVDTHTTRTQTGRLSTAQVQRAIRDAAAINHECELEIDEQDSANPGRDFRKIIDVTKKVNTDEADLATLLQTDADTKYTADGATVTMREMAANIAENASAAGTGVCGDVAKNMQAAMNGLPPS